MDIFDDEYDEIDWDLRDQEIDELEWYILDEELDGIDEELEAELEAMWRE